jgi:hypothetical protein
MADPATPEEWLALVAQHERVALAMQNDRRAAAQAYYHAGQGVECALKAYIMRRERLNGWPSRQSRPELYTHDLVALATIARISFTPQSRLAPSWSLVRQWTRDQSYDPKPMPRKVAKSWVEAAFGQEGIVTWLRATLK